MYGANKYVFTVVIFTLYGMPLVYNGQENGGEENQEGGNENLVKQPAAQLNVNGEVISGSGRRRKCGC